MFSIYPVRKPQYSCLSADRYAGGNDSNRKHRLIIEGRVKTMPFLTGFTSIQAHFIRTIKSLSEQND